MSQTLGIDWPGWGTAGKGGVRGPLGQGTWRDPDRARLQEKQPRGMTHHLEWDPPSQESAWFTIVRPLPHLEQSLSLRRHCSFARDILIGI